MTEYDSEKWRNLCTKYHEILDALNNANVVTYQKWAENNAASKAWDEFDKACNAFEDVKNKMEEFRKELISTT